MNLRLVLAFCALLFASDAVACRCAQRDLAEYFSAADVVVMARLQSSEQVESATGEDRELIFDLLASPYKGAIDHNQLKTLTASSSASCGVVADVGAVYVVFGRRGANETLRVDSCSGTRVHLSTTLTAPQGFKDTPARFVASQLNALFGMQVLSDVIASAPIEDDPNGTGFIGLLDLKALAHGGSTQLYAGPDAKSAVVVDVQDYSELLTREVGYEQDAAVVHARVRNWYRLRLADGRFAWASAQEAGTFFPYEQLPVRRLAYLTPAWSGLVWPEIGAGLPRRGIPGESEMQDEYPVEVLESDRIAGSLWFRVNVLDSDPCTDGAAKTRLSGWIPAYGRHGAPTVGYYSRGC